MTTTPRLALPLIAPGQMQKELFHNESLAILDALVAAAVEQLPLSTLPASPIIGSCYIIDAIPTGEWTEHAGHIASFSAGGWRFIAPQEGMSVFVREIGAAAVYHGGGWEVGTLAGSEVKIEGKKVLGPRGFAIAAPSGGTTIDAEARVAIGQILVAMREHGLIEI